MEHGGALITTIALGLSAAFLAGLVARRLGLPSIVGYLRRRPEPSPAG